MKQIVANKELVSFCGLYCGACSKYLKEKCPGCAQNVKATWCKTRSCCLENNYKSCADCKKYPNPMDCKYFDNFVSRIFGFIFRSDRNADIKTIKEKGYESFAKYMADNSIVAIKR